MGERTYVDSADKLPEGEHFVILEFGSISTPADERRQSHGYPESAQTTVQYVVFSTREMWEAEIRKRTTDNNRSRQSNWVPLICRRAVVNVNVNVSVEVDCGW